MKLYTWSNFKLNLYYCNPYSTVLAHQGLTFLESLL